MKVSRHDRAPRGYGFSYELWYEDARVCHPVPINLIVGLVRRFWIRLARGIRPHHLDRVCSELSDTAKFLDQIVDSYDLPDTASSGLQIRADGLRRALDVLRWQVEKPESQP